ncbi:thioredoxin family protein [Fundidesulfovibrio soli]|uniref:thioredoxin family protein n=1 Tax=Fundidesulfovibrio soli TaxID=2922716 RepID=UPI003AFA10C6
MRGGFVGTAAALVLAACIAVPVLATQALAAPLPEVPAKGTVTMVDLGAKSCIPCKMMIPVMDALEKDYAGKAAIIFIDVWENPEQGKKYGLRAIPTQIFYDRDGKETYRHEGFFDRKSIAEILDRLLAQ